MHDFDPMRTRKLIVYTRHQEDSPALDGAEHVALLVGEAGQAPSLVLQRGLALLLHVGHVAEIPHPHLEGKNRASSMPS
jgi:hypothetical protein